MRLEAARSDDVSTVPLRTSSLYSRCNLSNIEFWTDSQRDIFRVLIPQTGNCDD